MATPILLSLAILSLLPACAGKPVQVGKGDGVVASYRFRRLTADLPATTRVPAVAAAADSALRDRGYSVTSAAIHDDYANLSAKPFDPAILESMSVTVRQTAGGTRIAITAQPLGEKSRSLALLDAILDRLGY